MAEGAEVFRVEAEAVFTGPEWVGDELAASDITVARGLVAVMVTEHEVTEVDFAVRLGIEVMAGDTPIMDMDWVSVSA